MQQCCNVAGNESFLDHTLGIRVCVVSWNSIISLLNMLMAKVGLGMIRKQYEQILDSPFFANVQNTQKITRTNWEPFVQSQQPKQVQPHPCFQWMLFLGASLLRFFFSTGGCITLASWESAILDLVDFVAPFFVFFFLCFHNLAVKNTQKRWSTWRLSKKQMNNWCFLWWKKSDVSLKQLSPKSSSSNCWQFFHRPTPIFPQLPEARHTPQRLRCKGKGEVSCVEFIAYS